MTQERRVRTQFDADRHIAQAKVLRSEALASLGNRLFRLPAEIINKLGNTATRKKQRPSIAAEKAS